MQVFKSTAPTTLAELQTGDIAVEGSGRDTGEALSRAVRNHLSSQHLKDNMLPVCVANLQHLGQTHNFLVKEFGGAFSGMSISATGIAWQEDTLYIFPDFSDPLILDKYVIVRVECRDGVVIVKTHLPGPPSTVGFFPVGPERAFVETWQGKWRTNLTLNAFANSEEIRYVAVGGPEGRLFISDRRRPNPNEWIRTAMNADGKTEFSMADGVFKILQGAPRKTIFLV